MRPCCFHWQSHRYLDYGGRHLSPPRDALLASLSNIVPKQASTASSNICAKRSFAKRSSRGCFRWSSEIGNQRTLYLEILCLPRIPSNTRSWGPSDGGPDDGSSLDLYVLHEHETSKLFRKPIQVDSPSTRSCTAQSCLPCCPGSPLPRNTVRMVLVCKQGPMKNYGVLGLGFWSLTIRSSRPKCFCDEPILSCFPERGLPPLSARNAKNANVGVEASLRSDQRGGCFLLLVRQVGGTGMAVNTRVPKYSKLLVVPGQISRVRNDDARSDTANSSSGRPDRASCYQSRKMHARIKMPPLPSSSSSLPYNLPTLLKCSNTTLLLPSHQCPATTPANRVALARPYQSTSPSRGLSKPFGLSYARRLRMTLVRPPLTPWPKDARAIGLRCAFLSFLSFCLETIDSLRCAPRWLQYIAAKYPRSKGLRVVSLFATAFLVSYLLTSEGGRTVRDGARAACTEGQGRGLNKGDKGVGGSRVQLWSGRDQGRACISS